MPTATEIVFDGSFGPPDKPAAAGLTAEAVGQLAFSDGFNRTLHGALGRGRRAAAVAVAFANGAVGRVAVLPPVAGRSAGTHPLGSHARGVVDPLSALAIPAARGLAPLSACTCAAQRVFDGLTRFDVELFPSRVESIVLAKPPSRRWSAGRSGARVTLAQHTALARHLACQ